MTRASDWSRSTQAGHCGRALCGPGLLVWAAYCLDRQGASPENPNAC